MEETKSEIKLDEYFSPVLVELGDVNNLTFGAASGEADAGG
jgi:hypothetical protein